MINDKFGKIIKFIFSRKTSARLETNSFTHNLLTGLYATHCNQNGTKDWLEPAKLAPHVAGIFYLLTLNHFSFKTWNIYSNIFDKHPVCQTN